MPKKPQPLAKLSRPRLYDALPRERLFSILDQRRRHPVIWISGPPGAGKTTLVGTYVQTRRLQSAWMLLDPGDRDATSFFYFLSECCSSAGLASRALPRPGPEHLDDIAAFSRRYFRALFSGMPAGSLLVLDNFQEVDDCAVICTALDQAIAEVPQGCTLLVASRSDLPDVLVHHLAGQSIVRFGWDDLRLDVKETAAILGVPDEEEARQLHARVDGWVAGVVLMREGSSNPRSEADAVGPHEAVFAYFARQVFSQVETSARDVLLRTACLPYFSPQWACELTGNPEAGAIVESIFRRDLFTTRRDQGFFQYHALFRQFLMARTATDLSEGETKRLRELAGELLEQAGDIDGAFEAYAGAGDRMAVRRIVLVNAADLLKRGRWQTLARWCDAIGEEDYGADPWLVYWRGLAVLATDGVAAKCLLERAYRRFVESGSRTGELLALSHILGSYFLEWDTVDSMDPWIDAAQSVIRDTRPVSEEALVQAHANLMIALMYRRPQDAMLHVSAQWTAERVESEPDPTQKLRMAMFLAHYYDLMGEFSRAERALSLCGRILAREEADPLTAVIARMRHSQHHLIVGDDKLSQEHANAAVAAARELGFPDRLVGFLLVCRAHSHLAAGRLRDADDDLRAAGLMISPRHRMIVMHHYWCEFWRACLQGDRARLRSLWDAFATMPPAGVAIHTAYNLPVIEFLVAEGRFDQAIDRIARWNAMLRPMASAFIDFNLDIMEAYVHLRLGYSASAERHARAAFGRARARGFLNTLAWIPSVMSELCAFCLERDIETGHVIQMISARGLAAPAVAPENWPWRVRIHTLGRFEVLVEGRRLTFSGRPQHRTLELLKAIIAFGGRSVSVARVCGVLWPDAEGDAAQRAFSVALHRLRKLLEDDHALELVDGLITLDTQRIRVDAMVFEDEAHDASGLRLVSLYQGVFLEGEDASWILPRRQLLQSKFHHAVERVAADLEATGDLEGAADFYRQALEKDPLAEVFYRRLMVCRSRQGRHAEAMETYRRCREMLSIVLGIAPSADTQSLFRSIQTAGAATL